MFRFCNYWKTWNKVVKVDGLLVKEVSLMPIPGCGSSTWEEVARVNVRSHRTWDKRDVWQKTLPLSIEGEMRANLPSDVVEKLLEGTPFKL